MLDLFSTEPSPEEASGATLSECGVYRYRLWRRWDTSRALCTWVMLNPSTADAHQDDPTIRRCVGFAKDWGLGGIQVVNLYAYRATDPADLKDAGYPVGPENDQQIHDAVLRGRGGKVVVAWGTKCRSRRPGLKRDRHVLAIIRAARGVASNERNPVLCLERTKAGFPRHPLFVRADRVPVPYGVAP